MEIEAFITVHDQDLVIMCEELGQFRGLTNYSYLFVGSRPVPDLQLPPGVRMLHAAGAEPNFEHLPSFYDFTGWWAMMHNGWIRSKYIITLQYDMFIQWPDIEARCIELLTAAAGPIAFTAGHFNAGNFMLGLDGFQEAYCGAMEQRGVDTDAWPDFNEWPSSQGLCWAANAFVDFMSWFEPLFTRWKDELWAGHLAERTIKAWCVQANRREMYLPGAIRHLSLDSHGTCALMAGRTDVYAERSATFGR